MFIICGDNHTNPLGLVFKSSPHALLTKSNMADHLLEAQVDADKN